MPTTQSDLEPLLAEVAKHYPELDPVPIQRGFELAVEHLDDQRLRHVLDASMVLASMRMDPAAICACLVTSVGEDVGQEWVNETFGGEVGTIVEGVRRVEAIRWDRIEQEAAESLRKMFIAMAAEIRVVIIVLALRVQRMRAMESSKDEAARRRTARETIEVFAPLANRLGVWQFKSQLEDLALSGLEPETYQGLEKLLEERRQERMRLIQQAIEVLREKLPEQGIRATVNGRAKHLYSIFKKMQRKGVGLDQIHDVSAVRVITDKVGDCYAALGLVHSLWVPLPGQFDDYIARPKENLYRSLHTTVVGPEGKPLEIQIRTREMHDYAEYGVAAHWAYKEGRRTVKGADSKFVVLRQLMDWEQDVADPHQFAERLKTDVFRDQVYVFTPAGDIVDLPLGATPLDFAYRIHTMVGHRCRGARVNDQIVTLDYQLKTGDRVEILTHKKPGPSRDWLNPAFGYLRTTSARTKVRQWFREQGRDSAVLQGKEIVDRELQRLGLDHVTLAEIVTKLEYEKPDDLYAAVGFGIRSAHSLASAALQIERDKAPPEEPPPVSEPSKANRGSASGVSLAGVDDILGKRARCCSPVPGDDVVGFISRGRGIIIHRRDCSNIDAQREPERWVDIDWGPGGEERHPVDLEIIAQDRQGLLRDLSDLIAHTGANVRSVRADVRGKKDKARIRLSLDIVSSDQILRVLDKLERYRDVLSVRRVGK